MQTGNFTLLSKVQGNTKNFGDCFQGNNSYSGGGGVGGDVIRPILRKPSYASGARIQNAIVEQKLPKISYQIHLIHSIIENES
jgi:hypothetical protein